MPRKTQKSGSERNGTYLSAFTRKHGTLAMNCATRSPHAAQRNAGTRTAVTPIPGLRCAASGLPIVVVAESGLK